MKKPLYSVIIPTLNEEKFLPHLLASLTSQTKNYFEVIVVDGSSKDKTREVAESFRDTLPALTVLNIKAGVSRQRNTGAAAAKADWLVFVDADSVLLPYFLDRLHDYIQKQHPLLLTSWFRADSEEAGDAVAILIGNIYVEGSILLHRPLAPGPLTVVSKRVFRSVGGYDEDASFGEDHDLGRKFYEQHISLHVIRETLFVYSLRRFRQQGKLKLLHMYLKGIVSILFTKRAPKRMPGYITGGHLYGKKQKPVSKSVLKQFENSLKQLVKEFLE